jgi:predicted HTH domain antitoxin
VPILGDLRLIEMSLKILTIPYPEDLPEALGETPEEFECELRFLVAARLYELGRISSGRAAELAGMSRVEFLNRIGKYRISAFNYSLEELEQEIRQARARAEKAS